MTMQLSSTTLALLETLDTVSGRKLSRQEDLGTLIELAAMNQQQSELNDLSFLAKFVSKTYGIMERIGRGAEGYDKLTQQFTENMEKGKTLLRVLIGTGSADVKHQFESTYFAMTPSALQALLELFYSLSWYKNWQIDNRSTPPIP
jgi:hypothetical protein